MAMKRLLELMAEKKASDIFISCGAPISIKINGVTMPINQQIVTPDTVRALMKEILTERQLADFEENFELNTSYPMRGLGSFRISAFMQRTTPAIVVRFIPGEIPAFDGLGLPPVLKEIVMEKRGLILMVGATGSGKSTSLAAMIDVRNGQQSGHIITIEDPIEFLFKHKRSIVNQRELGTDAKSYHVALKNALRQAPDVILIGEVRDRETMTMAIAYAQSGHLCLATLHANNSYHALNRIISFYPLENRPALLQDLSSSLKCVVSQRLVRNLKGGTIGQRRGDAEHAPRRRPDREGRGQRHQGGDGQEPRTGLADLRAVAVPDVPGRHHLAGGGARERRLGHQPALADEQHRPHHRRSRRRACPEACPPAGGRAGGGRRLVQRVQADARGREGGLTA